MFNRHCLLSMGRAHRKLLKTARGSNDVSMFWCKLKNCHHCIVLACDPVYVHVLQLGGELVIMNILQRKDFSHREGCPATVSTYGAALCWPGELLHCSVDYCCNALQAREGLNNVLQSHVGPLVVLPSVRYAASVV